MLRVLADDFLSDSGCVYLGASLASRFHGPGTLIQRASFLGPTQASFGVWDRGQLLARKMSLGPTTAFFSVPEALSYGRLHGLCTYHAAADVNIPQYVFSCDTCVRAVFEARKREEKKDDSSACCEVTVLVCHTCAVLGDCHRGHVLVPIGQCSLARCDCGRGQVSILAPHHRRMMRAALAAFTSSSSPSRSSPFPVTPLYTVCDGEEEFTVDAVIATHRRNKQERALVRWLGWAHSACTLSVLHRMPAFPPFHSRIGFGHSRALCVGLLLCREPISSVREHVNEFRKLRVAQRAWRRAGAEVRGATVYPTHATWGTPIGSDASPPAWSLFPSCGSLTSAAARGFAWTAVDDQELSVAIQQQQREEDDRVQVKQEASGHSKRSKRSGHTK